MRSCTATVEFNEINTSNMDELNAAKWHNLHYKLFNMNHVGVYIKQLNLF